jgi:galactokinase
MDQLVAVLAPVGEAVLIDCRSLETRPVRLPKEAAVLVADTGVRHALSGTEYARRRRTCEAVAAILDVPALRDADVAMIESAGLTDEQRRRARHVVEENRRTLEAAEALEAGDLAAAGRLMRASHDSLRDLYEVSCPELDALVEAADTLARDGVAVHGARLTGGGFGGCVVILCDSEAANTVRKSLGGNVLQMSI